MPIFAIDSRSLRLFRVFLGLIVLWDIFDRSHYLEAHYATGGIVPLDPGIGSWSIHAWAGGLTGQTVMMLFHTLVAAAMILNIFPRASAILTFLFTTSLQHRNPMVNYGADDVLRLMLLYSVFLPFDRKASPRQIQTPATVAILVQIAVIFLCAGFHKIGDPTWRSGGALLQAVYAYPGPWSRLVTDHPFTFEKINFAVMALQFAATFALYPLLRVPVMLLFIGLQVGMALTMNLAMFPFAVAAAWTIFIPSSFWDRFQSVKALPAPRLKFKPALAAFLLAGVIIPAGGEIFENWNPKQYGFGFYMATGLRQHWRMFTPPPDRAVWSSFYIRGRDHLYYDLTTGKKFDGFHPVNSLGWTSSRWGHLSEQMDFFPDTAKHIAQYICRQGSVDTVHMRLISHVLSERGENPATWDIRPELDYTCDENVANRAIGSL